MSATADRSTLQRCNCTIRVVQRVTIAFEGEDLELVEQACRELAERARRNAEAVKGTSVERVHKSAQARFLGMAERLKVARR